MSYNALYVHFSRKRVPAESFDGERAVVTRQRALHRAEIPERRRNLRTRSRMQRVQCRQFGPSHLKV
jgi:hypothetical protein